MAVQGKQGLSQLDKKIIGILLIAVIALVLTASLSYYSLSQLNQTQNISSSTPTPTPELTPNPTPTAAPSPSPEATNFNQTYEVRITSFSVDPEGWKAPYDNDVVKCSVSVTLQNVGTVNVEGLKLIVILYRLGDVVGGEKQGVILGLGSSEPLNFVLRAGEVRSFQGEMVAPVDAIGTSDGHPVGATYMAQVKLGWGDTLDEAEWKPP